MPRQVYEHPLDTLHPLTVRARAPVKCPPPPGHPRTDEKKPTELSTLASTCENNKLVGGMDEGVGAKRRAEGGFGEHRAILS